MKLFNLLREKCGQISVQNLRKLENLSKQHASYSNHLRFNLRCKSEGIIPRSLQIQSPIQSQNAMNIIAKARKQLLRERINLNVKKIKNIDRELEEKQSVFLSNEAFDEEFRLAAKSHLSKSRENMHEKTKARHIGKIDVLIKKQKYNGLHRDAELDLTGTQLKRWVVNRSDRTLTDTETRVLARGLNFAISPEKVPVDDFILATESACQKLPAEERPALRAEIAGVLRSAKPPKPNISKEERQALAVLAKEKDILILPADKGRCTVLLNKTEYTAQVETMLSDRGT